VVVVEGTQTDVFLPPPGQVHPLPDDLDDVDGL